MPLSARDAHPQPQPLELAQLRLLRTDSSGSSHSGSGDAPSEWAKRKAQFLAHFRSASTAAADDAPPELQPAAEPPTDSKCHVCNVALRLLRMRVRFSLEGGRDGRAREELTGVFVMRSD